MRRSKYTNYRTIIRELEALNALNHLEHIHSALSTVTSKHIIYGNAGETTVVDIVWFPLYIILSRPTYTWGRYIRLYVPRF